MNRIPAAAPLCAALALALVGCDGAGSSGSRTDAAADTEAVAPSATPSPVRPPPEDDASRPPVAMQPPVLTPEAAKGESGARAVLLTWARALERKDFALARSLFGDHGARSGMSEATYAAQFAGYRTITVSMPTGRMEGAAGSLYYEAPTTVTGTTLDGERYKLQGPVVLRRVNDVPGASAEQLRWHIESTELKPVR